MRVVTKRSYKVAITLNDTQLFSWVFLQNQAFVIILFRLFLLPSVQPEFLNMKGEIDLSLSLSPTHSV